MMFFTCCFLPAIRLSSSFSSSITHYYHG
jgi:hypothetical protein